MGYSDVDKLAINTIRLLAVSILSEALDYPSIPIVTSDLVEQVSHNANCC